MTASNCTYYALFDDGEDDRPIRRSRSTASRYKIVGFLDKSISGLPHKRYEVFTPSVTINELNQGMRLRLRAHDNVDLQPLQVELKIGRSYYEPTVIWRTRTSLFYPVQNRWIYVIGCLDQELFKGQQYLYEAENDSTDECSARQLIQRTERMRVLNHIADGHFTASTELMHRYSAPHRRAAPAASHHDPYAPELVPPATADHAEIPLLSFQPVPAPTAPAALTAAAPTGAQQPPFAPKYVLELMKKDAIAKGESCPISMQPFEECGSVTITSCFHMFEPAAIQTWLTTHSSCPVCKQTVAARLEV